MTGADPALFAEIDAAAAVVEVKSGRLHRKSERPKGSGAELFQRAAFANAMLGGRGNKTARRLLTRRRRKCPIRDKGP